MEAAREAVMRARDEAARLRIDLQGATEAANSAAAREATLRNELATAREQFQQIVDHQTLQLLELTRELGARTPSPAPVPPPATDTRGDTRDDTVVCFDAIDAVLAASPL